MGPLEGVPAVVEAGGGGRGDVDLLPGPLADIADVDQPVVEGEAPRVAQAVGPHLGSTSSRDERVVGGHLVGLPAVDVDAKDRSEESVGILAVFERVAGPASMPP